MHSSTELDSELSTSSSSNAQIHRDRIQRNNGYMKVPLQKSKKKRREGQESEMKKSKKHKIRALKIHRIKTDETSSENLNDAIINIPAQNQEAYKYNFGNV